MQDCNSARQLENSSGSNEVLPPLYQPDLAKLSMAAERQEAMGKLLMQAIWAKPLLPSLEVVT